MCRKAATPFGALGGTRTPRCNKLPLARLLRRSGKWWPAERPGTAGDKSEIHTHKQMQLIAVHVERVHG